MIVYVGGYPSADRRGRAEGVSVFRTGAPGEPWRRLQRFAIANNPSLPRVGPDRRTPYVVHGTRTIVSALATDPALPILYAVNELACLVQSFRWDAASGRLRSGVTAAAVGSPMAIGFAVAP